jgi:hypothetical protein
MRTQAPWRERIISWSKRVATWSRNTPAKRKPLKYGKRGLITIAALAQGLARKQSYKLRPRKGVLEVLTE